MSLAMVLAGIGAAASRGMAQCDDLFIAGTPTAYAHLGLSVAISGDTIVAGAPEDYTNAGYQAGRGYVFIRQFGYPGSGTGGGYWTQQVRFDGPGQGTFPNYNAFGGGAAILGETAIFGDSIARIAYVTNRSGTVWSTPQALSRSQSMLGDEFGSPIAMTGLPARRVAVVGAFGYANNVGAAFVFTINSQQAGTWTQTGFLQASDGAPNDYFGSAVSASGTTIAVGASGFQGSEGPGAAYVFTGSLTGVNWTQQAKLTAFDGQPADQFGARVALSGDTLVITSPYHSPSGHPEIGGAVYVYVRAAGAWSLAVQLLPRSPARYYDNAVIDGDRIAVTADISTPAGYQTLVDIYTRPTGSGITGAWTYQRTIVPSDPLMYGPVTLALSGNVLVMGAAQASPLGVPAAGELHVVTLMHPCPADFNCSGGQPNVADIFAYLAAWFAHDFAADFNGDAQIMVNDIFAFLSAWFEGC